MILLKYNFHIFEKRISNFKYYIANSDVKILTSLVIIWLVVVVVITWFGYFTARSASPSLPAMFTSMDFATPLCALFLGIIMSVSPVSFVSTAISYVSTVAISKTVTISVSMVPMVSRVPKVEIMIDVSAVCSTFSPVFVSAVVCVFGTAFLFVAAVTCCNYCNCDEQ